MNGLEFFRKHYEIHGEFCGEVYRTKRNGEVEIYPYEPDSPYRRTPLTIRNERIRKTASSVSNPQRTEYSEIVRKLYYYTPYILNTGQQEFLAETVFYIREKGSYEFIWDDSGMGTVQKVYPRTKLSFGFHLLGTKLLNVYHDGALYCQRQFIITESENLDYEYGEWLREHLEEILELALPDYSRLKQYRRGLRSKCCWMKAVTGKFREELLFTKRNLEYKDKKGENSWIYHKHTYDHSINSQTVYFISKMAEAGQEWQRLSAAEREYWNNKANRLTGRRVSGFNLFTGNYIRGDSHSSAIP